MGGWIFPSFLHKGVDPLNLDDSMLIYYHDNLHILWSKLEEGYHFEWSFFEIYKLHYTLVKEMGKRGINHLAPINDLDKTHYFSNLQEEINYSVEKKINGIQVSVHKKGDEVKIFSEQKKDLTNIEIRSKDICELLVTQGEISEDSIGITGSTMIGLNNEDSDIDIIVYGTETSLKLHERLEQIFKSTNKIRKYNEEEYKIHYEWRVGGSDIHFEDFLRSEQRKQHQGKFMDKDFFIRYIKSPKDWKGNFYDYQYKNLGRIKLKAKIVDSRDSIFTPCSYKINPLKILETSNNSNEINVKDISEINSFRGRYCEQAKENEKVLVEGKLEKVIFKNELEYFRILLTDQIQDKMIII